jgi:SSS family solute:Na+ symporter
LGEFSTRLSVPTFWIVLIYGLFINIQNFGTDQNYIQRYLLTDTDKKAKYSAFLGGLIYVPVSALFLFIGTILYGYYQTNGLLPIEISETADKVFPYFIVNTLPVGFKGLLIASIFAAGMSTLSTSYNSSATILLIDYYNKYFNKKRVYFSQMHILYGSTILIALLGISVALAMINIKSALDAWWKLASIFSGGMLGLFLLGFLTKVKGNISPVIGTLVGVLSILVLSIPEFFKFLFGIENPFHNYLVIVIGTSIIFLTGFLFMIILKKGK